MGIGLLPKCPLMKQQIWGKGYTGPHPKRDANQARMTKIHYCMLQARCVMGPLGYWNLFP